MVRGEEGLVLQGAPEGMPDRDARLRHHRPPLRLQRRLRELAERLVRREEGLVL